MDLGKSNLNPSSLLDLKAELNKKYEVFKQAKVTVAKEAVKITPFRSKGEVPKEKKHLKVLNKAPIVDEEETKALQKSRLALEAKSKMYDAMVSSSSPIDDDRSELYLVDFQRKVLYNEREPKPSSKLPANSDNVEENISAIYSSDKLGTGRISQLNESEKNDKSDGIHYQDVQFNEVRDHGTAYFAFSTDESKRKEQMEELLAMRRETEETRLSKQRLLRKRKAMLQNRLAKICERKHIDQSVLEAFNTDKEPVTEESTEVDSSVATIPLPEAAPNPEGQSEDKPKPKIRPWDIGKEGLQHFVPPKSKIKSQKEWIEEQREERLPEFAPPTSYKR